MYQSNIARALGIPKSTLSVTLAKLEARGMVERRREGMENIVILRTIRRAEVGQEVE